MQLCLELARRGWGRVAPNPMVGAVLLNDEKVIGSGYHEEFGGPHAEIKALEAAADPQGSVCVVNLEPCTHQGKSPPCTEALIKAGVSRVVVAGFDPHPAAAGGLRVLEEAGIEVEVGLMKDEAAALNSPFLWNQARTDVPFVALKLATSVDGFIADSDGRSRWISGEQSREWVQWLRAGFDAIAVGRQTAESDDPELTVRGDVVPRKHPTRLVFTKSGKLRPNLRMLSSVAAAPTKIVEVVGSAGQRNLDPVDGIDVISTETLLSAFHRLRELDIGSVLVEGGGRFAAELLGLNLIDRFYWVQAPILLGRGVPAFGKRAGTALSEVENWVVTERRALGKDTLLVLDRALCLQV